MAKVHPIQTSFNAGEWASILHGKIDLKKYNNAVSIMENWEPLRQGPATVRPGSYYVAGVKTASNKTRLLSFEFSVVQAYILEMGNLYVRFYMGNGQIQSGGSPYEIVTPWLTADLFELKTSQSADILYVTHQDYIPRKISRTGHTAWSLATLDLQDGPYLNVNDTTTTFTPSGTTGSITITASAVTGINSDAGFQSTDVGRLIRFKDSANAWTWLKITGYTSTTVVTCAVMGADLASTTATAYWRLGIWSTTTGYPTCSWFFDGRFWLAGGTEYPQVYVGSVSDDFENFAPSDPDGTVGDHHSIVGFLNANDVNAIRWLSDSDHGLLCGTLGGPWVISAGGTTDEVLTSTNTKQKRSKRVGSADIQPVQTAEVTLFVERAKRSVRELAYVFEADGFKVPNVTVYNEKALDTGIVELAYQSEPQPYVGVLTDSGDLAKMLYDREQDAIGICRILPAGTDAKIESIAVIPSADGSYSELWFTASRTVNGATVRTVEYFDKQWLEGRDQTTAHFVDSGLVYNGSPATVISGLDHLEGEAIDILVDGAVHPSKTVSGGSITLDYSGSVVHCGLGYVGTLQIMRPEAGAQDGTAQGKTKKLDDLTLRLMDSGGLQTGRNTNSMYPIIFRRGTDPMSSAPPLYSGDIKAPVKGDYTTDGYLVIQHYQPLPATVLALMPKVVTYDE